MAQLELDTRMDINSIGRYVIRFFSHFFQLMPVERVSKLNYPQSVNLNFLEQDLHCHPCGKSPFTLFETKPFNFG